MRKKIVLAIAAISFGFSLNASAGYSYRECQTIQRNVTYYCSVNWNQAQCDYWLQLVRECDSPVDI